jgi:hypothetical protein
MISCFPFKGNLFYRNFLNFDVIYYLYVQKKFQLEIEISNGNH